MRREEFFAARVPWWTVKCPDCGVVTAADSAYFTGFSLLCESVRGRVSLTLVDLGLQPHQRAWCAERGVNIVPNPLPPDRHLKVWQAWYKPYYIAIAPYKYCLWLDADTMVVQDLNPLFASIQKAPLLLLHPAWGDGWISYEPALADIFGTAPTVKRHRINNGVLGFAKGRDEDDRLRALWMFMVNMCREYPAIRSLVNWWDEGCINWAITAGGFGSLLVEAHHWNQFTHYEATSESEFLDNIWFGPADVVLHFTGIKPWLSWK